jgi:hypothetical protein
MVWSCSHRQAHPVLGTALGQRQGQRNLVRGEPGLQFGNGVVVTPAGIRDGTGSVRHHAHLPHQKWQYPTWPGSYLVRKE